MKYLDKSFSIPMSSNKADYDERWALAFPNKKQQEWSCPNCGIISYDQIEHIEIHGDICIACKEFVFPDTKEESR